MTANRTNIRSARGKAASTHAGLLGSTPGVREPTRDFIRHVVAALTLVATVAFATERLQAQAIDGFVEPYYKLDLSAGEPGVVARINVEEGQAITANQELAALNTKVLEASLAIARKQAAARGDLESAQAELQLYRTKWNTIRQLRAAGNATQEEVDRAAADASIAQGKVKATTEMLELRQLEIQRIQQSINNLTVYAPFDGVVTRIYKDVGEYTPPNDPVIITMMQLSRLRATFSVPVDVATKLTVGQKVTVKMFPQSAAGTVEYVSLVTEPDSGTVRVRVQIDNREGLYRVGARCSLEVSGRPPRVSNLPRQ